MRRGSIFARTLAGLSVAVILFVPAGVVRQVLAEHNPARSSSPLGQISGLLPRNHLTVRSALQVNLTTETVRLPLFKGEAYGRTLWFVLLDASDAGIAHVLGVNYAPKLANIGIGCADCVQTVTLDSPTSAQNRFGQALVHFQGAPSFGPARKATPRPTGFPLSKFQPGAAAGFGYSPFIRIQGSDVVYDAPIVATGDGPFDVIRHGNTGDRVLRIHIASSTSPAGKYQKSWVDMLLSKGFAAGEPILYLSTDASQLMTAVLERATYVPQLDETAYNGGADFLGSSRERLFGFINGQTGATNNNDQGFEHLVEDGYASEDASLSNTTLINALRHGGDLLNVLGGFPTLADPQRAQAYSPLWDAQLCLWTTKAVKARLNKRQIDENVVLNLAAARPDLITGINLDTGQPAPFGSTGDVINSAVIGFTAKAPTKDLVGHVPHSQFSQR